MPKFDSLTRLSLWVWDRHHGRGGVNPRAGDSALNPMPNTESVSKGGFFVMIVSRFPNLLADKRFAPLSVRPFLLAFLGTRWFNYTVESLLNAIERTDVNQGRRTPVFSSI